MSTEAMKAGERFLATLRGEPVDRLPLFELAPWWDQTIAAWKQQGLPQNLENYIDIQEYFGLDLNCNWWFRPYGPETPFPTGAGVGHGMCIDEESYVKKLRPTLYPEPKMPDWFIERVKKEQARGKAITWFYLDGPFWEPREYLGIERHLMSFYDQPELYEMMTEDLANWSHRVIEYATNTLHFDFINFAEDMSYNNGPMISEETFDTFIAPFYQKILPEVRAHGLFPIVDSDGEILLATDWYRKVGAKAMWPLERQAGVDIALYLEKFPDMGFVGHYDKMVMPLGEEAMRAEFERLAPSAKKGRYVISVDHQTPPGVTLQQYQIYLKLFREYAPKICKR